MSNSTVNKAILIEKENERPVVKDWTIPKATKNTIVVKNEYAGINFIDTYQLKRIAASYETPFPYVLGREGAGTVYEAGDSTEFKNGDKVVYFGQGTYANYTLADARNAIKIPNGVSSKVAAAALLQGLTGWFLVKDSHVVQKSQWMLVQAAAGGMGLVLCQLGKYLGARVIGTASTNEKLALAKEHGAEFVINYSNEDVEKRVMEITDGKGVDVIYDGVGKATFATDLKIVAFNGSLITFGNSSGPVDPISPLALTPRNIRLMRPAVFNYIRDPEVYKQSAKGLYDLIAQGHLNIKIFKTYSLDQVEQAHEDLTSRKTTGKLVIEISPTE